MAGGSVPVDLGRITYAVSSGQRRALVARDRGCIVPGCKRKARWCEAHHVIPWPKGPTDLDNLVLLCKRHHKQVHALVINLQHDPVTNRWVVTNTDGAPLRQRPPPLAA
jgi:5-methylcytosine-specific restriction protein A